MNYSMKLQRRNAEGHMETHEVARVEPDGTRVFVLPELGNYNLVYTMADCERQEDGVYVLRNVQIEVPR